MSSPHQVKSNTNQTNTSSTTSSSQQTLSWEVILKSPRIEKQHIEYALNHIDNAPVIPYEFVYRKVATDIKIFPPTSVAISGVGGVIGAVLALRHATNIKYFITTNEVLNADEKSTLFLARYAIESLEKKHNDAQIITIDLGEFEKIKMLLSKGGIYISGLPNELIVEIAQLAGFGRLWHFSPIHRKFYIF
jgi:hypothetical protein